MRNILQNRPVITALTITLIITTVLLLPAWWMAGAWYEERLVIEERAHVASQVVPYGNALTTAVNDRFALLEGLDAFIQTHPTDRELDKNFEPFAAGLYSQKEGIRAIMVFPRDLSIKRVYPVSGNEAVLKGNFTTLVNDDRPTVRADVQRALYTRNISTSGPYELRQGGLGLVARLAVYQNETLWGITSLVFDVPPILNSAGLSKPPEHLDLALRDAGGNVFFGSNITFAQDPVIHTILVGDQTWDLSAIPKGGWTSSVQHQLFQIRLTGLVIIGLLASLLFLMINRQGQLAHAVKSRTAALAASQYQYQTLLENVHAAVVVHNSDTSIRLINRTALDLLGLTEDEGIGRKAPDPRWRFFREDGSVLPLIEYPVNQVINTHNPIRNMSIGIFRPRTNDMIWVLVNADPETKETGAPSGVIVTFIEVTEKKQAEEGLRRKSEELYAANEELIAAEEELKSKVALLAESEGRVRQKLESLIAPDGDIGILELADIIDSEALQQLMEDFTHITGMVTAILDTRGKVIVATGWQDICTKFHRINPVTAGFCTESDLHLAKNVKRGEYVAYKCKNNLWDVVTPLYIGSRHMGNIFTGQFFYDDEIVDDAVFLEQSKKYGFDQEAYLAALHRVPKFSRERIPELINYLVKLTDIISLLSYSNLKLARTATERNVLLTSLQESEVKYRTLVENIPQMIFLKDVNSRYLSINENFARDLGIAPEAIVGKTDADLFPDKLATRYRESDIRILTTGQAEAIEERYPLDGKETWISMIKTVARDHQGEIVGILGVFSDITDRKQAENGLRDAKEYAENLLQSANVMIIGLDMDGVIRVFNNTAEKLTGYSFDEMKGKNWFEVLVPKDRYPETWSEFLHITKDRDIPKAWENPILTKTGEERYISWQNSRIMEHGEIVGTLSFGMDITEKRKADAIIKLKDELLHLTGEMAHVGGWEFDATTMEGTWTDEVARIHDLDPSQPTNVALGISFYAGESKERINIAVTEAIEQKKPYDLELEMKSARGVLKWVRIKGIPIVEGGRTVKVQGILQDITERKKAETEILRQNRTLHLLSAASSLLVHIRDEQDLLDSICRMMIDLGGYRMAWVGYAENDTYKSVRPVAESGFDEGYLATITITWKDDEHGRGPTGTAIRTGKHSIARDIAGDPAYIPWRESAIKQGYASSIALPLVVNSTVIGALSIYSADTDAFELSEIGLLSELARDLSYGVQSIRSEKKRIEAEENLLKAHQVLEQKVIERTRELSDANVRLKELDQLKSMFIASMSHELRTPLNSIIGFTGIILKGMVGEINPEQKKQLGMVRESAHHLLALINDVIDISKIEAGKIEVSVSTFDLSDLIREARDLFTPVIEERGLVLVMEIPYPILIFSDKRRVMQILLNLISNAIKFTDRGSIEVITLLREDRVEISVRDTGIGISKENLTHLFQPFFRVIEPGRLTEGTGLGLYLSQRLARFLGGKITAESEQNKGTVFTFTFLIRYTEQEDI